MPKKKASLKKTISKVTDFTANPAPLGLAGFGMTTILLNMHNIGLFPIDSMIIGMGLFYGGISQVIVGIMEWKKGNTFGTTAFTSYGLFWLSLVMLLVAPKLGIADAPNMTAMSAYLFVWGLFTLGLTIGTIKTNRVLQFIFASLTTLFFLLALGDYTGNANIKLLAGAEGIICGFSAFYLSMAEVLNEKLDKEVLPIFPVK